MKGLYLIYCNLMKYVDLFVAPVWNYFRQMSGGGLLFSTIFIILIAVALYAITSSNILEYDDSPMKGYLWICKMLFLPMVAFLGMIFSFEGMEAGNLFTIFFIRKGMHISLSNIAEWDMPFAEIILLVIAIRSICGFLYCIIKLDILEMLRFQAGMLSAMLVGMCTGRFILSMMESESHLTIALGNILGFVIAFGAALIFAIGITKWIRDLFSPIVYFFGELWQAGDVTLVDKFGNRYKTNVWIVLMLMFTGWRI